MDCVSSIKMQVLWNGEHSLDFTPFRGIHQGDPVSPYLFVLCMEQLSYIIQDARNGTKLSHIFFADDMILFDCSSTSQMEVMKACLNKIYEASGAKVSVEKTKIYFLKNTIDSCCRNISQFGGFERVNNLGKYFWPPILFSKITKATYSYILETL